MLVGAPVTMASMPSRVRLGLLIYRVQVAIAGVEVGMATKVTVALEDDLDGGPADETVRFAFGGAEYEIDLNKRNARAFRKQLAPFIDHARRAGRGPRRRAGRSAASRDRSGAIRGWAHEQGLAVSARGRIPASVVEQYEAATGRR